MRIFLAAMMAAFQLATCIGAHAHGDDKPKRGGTMGRGDDSVSIELVMEESMIVLYVEEHANHVPISSVNVEQLHNERVLLFPHGFKIRALFDRVCRAASAEPHIVVEAGDARALVALAEAGAQAARR